MVKRQYLDGQWVDTSTWPHAITPPDARWRDMPYWKFDNRDIDPSDIDVWNEARLGKLVHDVELVQRSLDGPTCRKLCRYFLIFAENVTATSWWMKPLTERASYLAKMAPVIKTAREMAARATKREDVDRMYDYLCDNSLDPV